MFSRTGSSHVSLAKLLVALATGCFAVNCGPGNSAETGNALAGSDGAGTGGSPTSSGGAVGGGGAGVAAAAGASATGGVSAGAGGLDAGTAGQAAAGQSTGGSASGGAGGGGEATGGGGQGGAGGGSAGSGGAPSDPTAPLHVLIIGNSFTFYNDLEVWLQDVAAPGLPTIFARRLATPSVTLKWHWDNDAQPAIKDGWQAGVPWSHVVIQGQSTESINDDGTAAAADSAFQTYAAKLVQAVRDVKGTPVLEETWAYRACNADYPAKWGGTPDKMQDGLLAGYTLASSNTNAGFAKVGEGWRAVWTSHPEISLDKMYDPDCKHPGPWGTYLTALVLYVRITGHAVPSGGKKPAGMSDAIAQTLQSIALQVGKP